MLFTLGDIRVDAFKVSQYCYILQQQLTVPQSAGVKYIYRVLLIRAFVTKGFWMKERCFQ
jgi:hypothetical protein